MNELIQLLKEAGVVPSTLIPIAGSNPATVMMPAPIVHFYRGTPIDAYVSHLIDEGELVVVFENDNAYFQRGN